MIFSSHICYTMYFIWIFHAYFMLTSFDSESHMIIFAIFCCLFLHRYLYVWLCSLHLFIFRWMNAGCFVLLVSFFICVVLYMYVAFVLLYFFHILIVQILIAIHAMVCLPYLKYIHTRMHASIYFKLYVHSTRGEVTHVWPANYLFQPIPVGACGQCVLRTVFSLPTVFKGPHLLSKYCSL